MTPDPADSEYGAPEVVGLLAQLTDLHVRTDGHGAENDARIAVAIDAVRGLEVRPDVILLTGDLVNTGTEEEYARLAEVLAPLRADGHQLLPLVGNHDDRDLLRRTFADVPEIAALGEARHVQYVAERGSFRVVALDTQRLGSDAGKLCETRMRWVEETLAAATGPTVVAMHHPPGVVGLPAFDRIGLPDATRERLRRALESTPFAELVVHGHVHRTITTRHGGTPAFGCPSVAFPARPDLLPGVPIELVPGPVGFAMHLRLATGDLVTHARMYPAP